MIFISLNACHETAPSFFYEKLEIQSKGSYHMATNGWFIIYESYILRAEFSKPSRIYFKNSLSIRSKANPHFSSEVQSPLWISEYFFFIFFSKIILFRCHKFDKWLTHHSEEFILSDFSIAITSKHFVGLKVIRIAYLLEYFLCRLIQSPTSCQHIVPKNVSASILLKLKNSNSRASHGGYCRIEQNFSEGDWLRALICIKIFISMHVLSFLHLTFVFF